MIDICTVAYNTPWVIEQQIRLFKKNLLDEHTLSVYDNSTDAGAQLQIKTICANTGTRYLIPPSARNEHDEALNFAAKDLLNRQASHIGFVDHDLFCAKPTTLVPLIDQAGFIGIGQRHHETGLYPWPGFAFFSRKWLHNKPKFNFSGYRGEEKREDGDCGSMLASMFTAEDWDNLIGLGLKHGYETIRPQDAVGSQSWAVEWIGTDAEGFNFLHITNASGWLRVPEPHVREAKVREKVSLL